MKIKKEVEFLHLGGEDVIRAGDWIEQTDGLRPYLGRDFIGRTVKEIKSKGAFKDYLFYRPVS